MSEPENSQTESSSSKEENATSKENVALDSITNTESITESDKEDTSASPNDGNVPAKSEEIQNEPNAPSIETTEKIKKSEEKLDPFLKENTDASSTSTLCISDHSILINVLVFRKLYVNPLYYHEIHFR